MCIRDRYTQTVCEQISPSSATALQVTNVSGGIPPYNYNYQWWQISPGTPIIVGTNSSTFTPPTDQGPGTFTYECVITNDPSSTDCEYTTNTHTLIVNPSPDVTILPNQNTILCVGGTIPNLEADATGPGAIDWEWQLFDGTNWNTVATGNAPNDGINPTYSAPTNIANVYEYRCVVNFSSGGCSSQTSDPIIITTVSYTHLTLPTKA